MAWRVRPEPWLRRTIDIGRAACWIRARSSSGASPDIGPDGLKLRRPSVGVAAVRNVAPLGRQAVEARLGDPQLRPAFDAFEFELDQRRSFARVVGVCIDRMRVPSPGKDPRGLHPLDRHLPGQVLVARMSDAALQSSAGREVPVEVDAEPGAELRRRCQRLPYAGNWRAHEDLALDAIQAEAHVSSRVRSDGGQRRGSAGRRAPDTPSARPARTRSLPSNPAPAW